MLLTLILRSAPNSWHRATGEWSTKMSQALRHLHHRPGRGLVAGVLFLKDHVLFDKGATTLPVSLAASVVNS